MVSELGKGPRRWLALGLAVTLAVAAACSSGDDDSADGGGDSGPTKITVGTLPIANAAPMYLGMEKGFFEEENLTIEPQVGEGGAALIPSLVSGDAQFAFVGVIPAITAVAQDVPIRIVTSSDDAAATEDEVVPFLGPCAPILEPEALVEGQRLA